MQKIFFSFMVLILLSFALTSFADENETFLDEFSADAMTEEPPARNLYITGEAEREDHLEFFLYHFGLEAYNMGYFVTDNKAEAAYTFHFTVLNTPESLHPYNILIHLYKNTDEFELLSYNFYFSDHEEMEQYIPFFIYIATINIFSQPELVVVHERASTQEIDIGWQYSWLYAWAALVYPIKVYRPQGNGLINGIGIYEGSFNNPSRVMPLDNKVVAIPGLVLGGEVQILDFLSFGLYFLFDFGDPDNNNRINVSLGTDIKYQVKYFENFIIEPSVSFLFPLNISPIFSSYPPFAIGAGAQLGIKKDKNAILFSGIKYLFYTGDAVMKNIYAPLYTQPSEIHYRVSQLRFSIGYKYGFFERKTGSTIIDFIRGLELFNKKDSAVEYTEEEHEE